MVCGKRLGGVSGGQARGKEMDSYVRRLGRWPRLCVRRDVAEVGNGERIGTGRVIGRQSAEIRSRGHAAGSVAIARLGDAGRLEGRHLFPTQTVERQTPRKSIQSFSGTYGEPVPDLTRDGKMPLNRSR